MPDILDGLRYRVEQEQLGYDRAPPTVDSRYRRQRIDDRNGIEDHLLQHVPDMRHIAEVDIHGSHDQREAQGQNIQLEDADGQQQDSPSEMHSTEDSKDEDHDQIDAVTDQRPHGSRYHHDVIGKVHLAQKVAAIHNRTQAYGSRLVEELPGAYAQKQHNRIGRRAISHPEEFSEDQIHDHKEHQRLQNRPGNPKKGSLIPELEISLDKLTQNNQ